MKKNKEKEDLENKKRKEILNYKAVSTSNKYLYNKFKKSFKKEIEKILIEKGKNKKNYNQLKNIFTNLNFIPKSQSENENINNWLNEIYENLKNSHNLISIEHLFIFSLSIVKLFKYYILQIIKQQIQQLQPQKVQETMKKKFLIQLVKKI